MIRTESDFQFGIRSVTNGTEALRVQPQEV